ncbi:MAG: porin [Bryobacteraceae bacterium]|jgi:phosphate-selective porin OprO/OprP
MSRQRNIFIGLALIIGMPSIPALAQSTDQKIQDLEQKVEQLDQEVKVAERNKELKDEDAANQAKNAASVTADTSGFTIKSNDGDFLLKIGADLQVDNRAYVGDGAAAGADTILLRRVRPTFSGTVYKFVDFFFRPDFGQGTTVIYDAYLELKYFSKAKVRVGKFKPPVGLERLQSDDDTSFVERGLPTLLVPSRDIGYQISGDVVPKLVNYAVGVFNGVPDNGLGDVAVSSHRDYAARLFLTPFSGAAKNPLRGLGFGSGISGGGVDGIALPSYKTFGQTTFFTFASGVTSAGHRTRLTPQGYYYLGPFGLLSEYTLTEEGFKKGLVQKDIAFRAWQVEATWILTGENKSFTSPTPKRSFDPRNHGWGAVELAARVGDFSAEKGIYNYGFASSNTTPRHAHEVVGGVNWYLNRLFRISVDYGNTNFGGGAVLSNRLSERVLIGRFQVNFI